MIQIVSMASCYDWETRPVEPQACLSIHLRIRRYAQLVCQPDDHPTAEHLTGNCGLNYPAYRHKMEDSFFLSTLEGFRRVRVNDHMRYKWGKILPFGCQWPSRFPKSALGARSAAALGAVALVCAWVIFPMPTSAQDATGCDKECLEARREILLGDWYVLIHFDGHPEGATEGPQWEDQIWRIKASKENLRWTIFPHVEMKRTRGRYQERSDGLVALSPGTWSPDAQQWEEIRSGLKTDPYSSRSKTLRPSGAGAWRSSGRLRSASASMVGYHELWEIVFEDDGPVFSRVDSMGSARTDVLDGQTRFVTEERDSDTGELVGRYQRGETLEGRFRLVRMEGPDALEPGS